MIDINIDEYNEIRNNSNPLDDLVDWASNIYGTMRKEKGLSIGDGDCWEGEIVELERDCIITHWEYTWSYGGCAEGECVIPLGAIVGNRNERLNFIQSVVDKEANVRDIQKSDRTEQE